MTLEPNRPWVLLRGLGREARHWGDFPTLLANTLGGATVLTPDLAGNGQRWRQRSAGSVGGQLAGLRTELAAVLAGGPVNVLAISLGGMVALEWAGQQPDEVQRLVLINTSLAALAPFWQRLRWQNYLALVQLTLQSPAQREATILRLTSNHHADNLAMQIDWQRWQAECPVSTGNLLRQLMAAARYRPPRSWPDCPALIICSEQDRLVDPACSHALAQATQWPLLPHNSAGHDLALDAPPWLAAHVVDWCGLPPELPAG